MKIEEHLWFRSYNDRGIVLASGPCRTVAEGLRKGKNAVSNLRKHGQNPFGVAEVEKTTQYGIALIRKDEKNEKTAGKWETTFKMPEAKWKSGEEPLEKPVGKLNNHKTEYNTTLEEACSHIFARAMMIKRSREEQGDREHVYATLYHEGRIIQIAIKKPNEEIYHEERNRSPLSVH